MSKKTWSGEQILELAWGFDRPVVLTAAADLGIFGLLGDGSMSAEEVAKGIDADLRGTKVLLDALSAMELLESDGHSYRNAAGVGDLLAEQGDESVLAMVRHAGACLRRWSQLEWVVKSGKESKSVPSVRGAQADAQAFIEAMHVINRKNADYIVEKLRDWDFRCLLDVGGGSGTWTLALLRGRDEARAIIFDLPDVVELARRRVDEAGFGRRVEVVGGDYTQDELPSGADMALVSAVVHQNSRQENRELFGRVWRALENGGSVVVRDVLMDSATEPAEGAMFAVNMLVATQGGGTYTFEQLKEDMQSAGFRDVKVLHRAEYMNSLVVGRKSG